MTGRFAPSPTGELHLGNLRTAAVAWLAARAAGGLFLLRVEDLDRQRSRPEHEERQLADLRSIGLDWDGPVVRQSERFDRYEVAIDRLRAAGLTYECYCTRRRIREEIEAAPSAPHLPPDAYPGICRDLDPDRAAELRAAGRTPALRLRADAERVGFRDGLAGHISRGVDDFVLRRNDGTPAYNVAVVVDDAGQGVGQVVRGDDLLDSTPRQILLQRLLGYDTPEYVHVPLVLNEQGQRLAKRDGAVTLAALAAAGVSAQAVVDWIARSLDLAGPGEHAPLAALLGRFDIERIPRQPVIVPQLA
ncbi:MAG: tRNA glutamyl-Q(34) synthetase GluQRS [Chloroflexota bacterium]|jgi:glutamyl-tRNA synthetase